MSKNNESSLTAANCELIGSKEEGEKYSPIVTNGRSALVAIYQQPSSKVKSEEEWFIPKRLKTENPKPPAINKSSTTIHEVTKAEKTDSGKIRKAPPEEARQSALAQIYKNQIKQEAAHKTETPPASIRKSEGKSVTFGNLKIALASTGQNI